MQRLPAQARWSLVAVDCESGEAVIDIGGDEPLKPGSLVKLFTAGALFDAVVRPDFTTYAAVDGKISDGVLNGSLFLIGKGNALLSVADLKTAAKRLSEAGIKEVRGDVAADDSYFDVRGINRPALDTDSPAFSFPGALGIDLHTVSIKVAPAEAGMPPLIEISPPNGFVRIALTARTSSLDKTGIAIRQIDDLAYEVSGNIPASSAPLHKRFSLKDPALYAAGAFYSALTEAGIKVAGTARKGRAPEGSRTMAALPSPPAGVLADALNKKSVNLLADNLLFSLGAAAYGAPATYAKSVRYVEEFLSGFGLDAAALRISDGSGISNDNMVSAAGVVRFLQSVVHAPWYKDFYNSLSSPGEGTLSDIGFVSRDIKVKTGQLEDAYAVAGYVRDKKDRLTAFAFMVNTHGADHPAVTGVGVEVLRKLAND
ncbi:MAG: D-alanyl-D-alanine carboxypeptidase/D-alanyl-D-alanine-endopeptidase [Deltaproteobacteria bacterium]|nr:D-alanyl-D-alanine carboxypeptidase/D-alanyl-D-alanine-endopeptidase [Deltaproteobacteria bacterium]